MERDDSANDKKLNLCLSSFQLFSPVRGGEGASSNDTMMLHSRCRVRSSSSPAALAFGAPSSRKTVRRPSTLNVAAKAAARPPSLAGDWRDLKIRHVVESQQFSRECMDLVFETAREMETVRVGSKEAKQLEGRVMATLFYEPSTRTRLSFESAMARLGGTVLSTESAGEYSSAAKGETLEGKWSKEKFFYFFP